MNPRADEKSGTEVVKCVLDMRRKCGYKAVIQTKKKSKKMKKRIKITLRTKIYLTIVGCLALTGVLYAANPVPFTAPGAVPFPTGVAAAPDLLLVTEYCFREHRSGRLQRECLVVRNASGVWFLPGKILDYSSFDVRECRVHPARRFHHRRRFGLQDP